MDAIPWTLAALIGGGLVTAIGKLYLDGQKSKDALVARLEGDLREERELNRDLLATAGRSVGVAERTLIERRPRDGG